MNAEQLAKLRAEFPGDRIGILPKPYKKDSPKGYCKDCGKSHGLPAVHLDYVGHGAVTERLLEVDPEWNWEPVAWADDGNPAVIYRGNTATLWIRLTIGGVSRLGVGTASAEKPEHLKELIGDSIRNAAMRFGVALDLWIKGDKHDDPDVEPSPGEIAEKATNKLKADVLALVGDRDLAVAHYASALTAAGFSVDDPIPADRHGEIVEAVRARFEADIAPFVEEGAV